MQSLSFRIRANSDEARNISLQVWRCQEVLAWKYRKENTKMSKFNNLRKRMSISTDALACDANFAASNSPPPTPNTPTRSPIAAFFGSPKPSLRRKLGLTNMSNQQVLRWLKKVYFCKVIILSKFSQRQRMRSKIGSARQKVWDL